VRKERGNSKGRIAEASVAASSSEAEVPPSTPTLNLRFIGPKPYR
jgi:hypothetical protein